MAASLQNTLISTRCNILPAYVAGIKCAQYSTNNDIRPIKNTSLAALKKGTGGRSSFNGIVATVFGASGLLGRYLCNRLGKIGTQIIIPYRGDHYDVLPLKLVGDLGQVLFQPYQPRDLESVHKAIKYSNVVINLIGREWETKNFTFHDVNVKIPRMLAKMCKEQGVEKFVHVSHINAAEKPKGHFLKGGSKHLATKWEGEQAVKEEFPEAIIFKPSDMYGGADYFFRSFGHMWRHQGHWLPVWKKGEHTVKQPVFVADVAAGITAAIRDRDIFGQTYFAVGPKRYKLSDLVDYLHGLMRKDKENWGYWRYDMRYDPFFQLRISITEKLPGEPVAGLCWDRMERECVSDRRVIDELTLEDLGVTLTHLEDQAPYETRIMRAYEYYDSKPGEFKTPAPPATVNF